MQGRDGLGETKHRRRRPFSREGRMSWRVRSSTTKIHPDTGSAEVSRNTPPQIGPHKSSRASPTKWRHPRQRARQAALVPPSNSPPPALATEGARRCTHRPPPRHSLHECIHHQTKTLKTDRRRSRASLMQRSRPRMQHCAASPMSTGPLSTSVGSSALPSAAAEARLASQPVGSTKGNAQPADHGTYPPSACPCERRFLASASRSRPRHRRSASHSLGKSPHLTRQRCWNSSQWSALQAWPNSRGGPRSCICAPRRSKLHVHHVLQRAPQAQHPRRPWPSTCTQRFRSGRGQ
mmetsp:Transcript_70343/g.183171  ORF Transcript_70343/g.183171 Transcript_70343/m.183171 type:complete len:293 (+) Transcript_70343:1043-1921(+)